MKDVFSSTEVNRILSSGSEAEKMRKFYEHWVSKIPSPSNTFDAVSTFHVNCRVEHAYCVY